MAKKTIYEHTVKVAGLGRFPLDMLRYDQLEPATEEDRRRIEDSQQDGVPVDNPITLVRRHDSRDWEPTKGRWGSFLWGVIDHEIRRAV